MTKHNGLQGKALTRRIEQLERELEQLKNTARGSPSPTDESPGSEPPLSPPAAQDATETVEQLLARVAERYTHEDLLRAQEALVAARAQTDLANRTKSEFLARMSHEIRTPMNAIIGLGHLLRDTSLDSQQRGYLDSISAAADSLLHIINQVLDFSKIETGKIVLENTHFDLEQVFEKLSRLFEVSAAHRQVDITYDLHPDVPRFLRGDTARLGQVLSHLVDNALQYSAGGNVLVSVGEESRQADGVMLRFCITDFGAGMTSEQVAELTSHLKAVAEGERLASDSTGLHICHHLIRLMGGDLSIKSRAGKGCRISFTAWFEHSQIGAKALRDQPHRFEQLRALIVDDNTLAREIISGTLQNMGIEADTADSGETALKQIRRADQTDAPYELVLMDYQMPRMDGLTTIAALKADDPLRHPPRVLLISSYHRDEIFQDHQHAELVDGFLSKPVSESRLFDALSQAFGPGMTDPSELLPGGEVEVLGGLRVLLVEDNRVNQQVAEGILRKRGVTVTIANNGREALERLQATPEAFDVILMDLEMPEVDGYEATGIIRSGSLRPDIPIVAITAQAIGGDRERCLDIGMNGYISKPIRPERLYQTLADVAATFVAPNVK